MSSLKGFRTVIFNIIMGAIMVIRAFNPEAELPDEVAVQGAVDAVDAAISSVWLVGNLILRAITDSSIFKKEPDSP